MCTAQRALGDFGDCMQECFAEKTEEEEQSSAEETTQSPPEYAAAAGTSSSTKKSADSIVKVTSMNRLEFSVATNWMDVMFACQQNSHMPKQFILKDCWHASGSGYIMQLPDFMG